MWSAEGNTQVSFEAICLAGFRAPAGKPASQSAGHQLCFDFLQPCANCCSQNRLIFSCWLLAMAVSGRIADQYLPKKIRNGVLGPMSIGLK
jgi:hypothetical protein